MKNYILKKRGMITQLIPNSTEVKAWINEYVLYKRNAIT